MGSYLSFYKLSVDNSLSYPKFPKPPLWRGITDFLVAVLSKLSSYLSFPDRTFNLSSSCFSQARGQWLTQSCLLISSANPHKMCNQSLVFTWKWLFSVKVLSPKRFLRVIRMVQSCVWSVDVNTICLSLSYFCHMQHKIMSSSWTMLQYVAFLIPF